MNFSPRAVQDVRDAVRAALRVEAGLDPEWSYPSRSAPENFIAAVHRHRVESVLSIHAAQLDLPADVHRNLVESHRYTALRAMALLGELTRLLSVLDAANIRALTFKGPALAALTTGDFTARGSGDLDIFVAPMSVPEAHEALLSGGWTPPETYPRPGRTWAWRHLLSTQYELPFVGELSTVDLHWRLDPIRGALPSFDEAWEQRQVVNVGGQSLPTLSWSHALAHSSSHAAKDDWRWIRSLVDIHRLCRHPAARPIEWRRVDEQSFAVTRECIGLPPNTVLRPTKVGSRAVRVARKSQRGVPPYPGQHWPGIALLLSVPRISRGHSPHRLGGLTAALSGMLLPPSVTAGLEDRHAVTGLPRAMLRRACELPSKVRRWAGARG